MANSIHVDRISPSILADISIIISRQFARPSYRAGDLVWINCILFLHPCPLPPLPHSILVSTAGSWPKTSNFCRHQGLGGKIKCQANDHFVKTCHLLRGTDTKMKLHQITVRGCTYIVKKMLKTLIFLFNQFKKLCYIPVTLINQLQWTL